MSKGRIIYIGAFELPDKNAAAHRVLSNAKIFQKLDYDVVFIGCDKSLNYDSEILATEKQIQEFDCFFTPYPSSKIEWIHYLSNIDSFKKILGHYDDVKFVICYNYQSLALKKIMRLCNKKNIKIISDCTEWYSASGRGLLFLLLKGFDVFYRMTILHKKLDGIIVISDYLERYYLKCKNVINVPPLVDISEEKWQSKSKKENEVFTFVYAGSPGKKDRLDVLIEALSKVRFKYIANIVGITKEEFLSLYPNHKNLIEKSSNNIYFNGRLSHLESLEYVKNADCFCFFRENNRVSSAGFPTKLVESVSAETPIITNISSNIEKYFNEFHLGICLENCDPNIIKNAIEEFYNQNYNYEINRSIFDYNNYIKEMIKLIGSSTK